MLSVKMVPFGKNKKGIAIITKYQLEVGRGGCMEMKTSWRPLKQ